MITSISPKINNKKDLSEIFNNNKMELWIIARSLK